jgi:hypothetical protein
VCIYYISKLTKQRERILIVTLALETKYWQFILSHRFKRNDILFLVPLPLMGGFLYPAQHFAIITQS